MIEPVEIILESDHSYKKRPKRVDEKKGKTVQPPGCAHCGAAKLHRRHLGAPPSFNDGGSGLDRMAYQALKNAWQEAFADLLARTDLPRGLESVQVEGQVGFPTNNRRDEGNLRWLPEKALGDALKDGGYLPDDQFFPVRMYSFGNLEGVLTPGRSFLRLMIYPRAAEPANNQEDQLWTP